MSSAVFLTGTFWFIFAVWFSPLLKSQYQKKAQEEAVCFVFGLSCGRSLPLIFILFNVCLLLVFATRNTVFGQIKIQNPGLTV